MSTRKLVTLAMLTAISVILVYLIRFPIFPAAAFLEYDPADIPILFGTLAFGPISGLILTAVVSVLQGVTVSASSGPIGILMHIFATGSFVLTAGLLCRKNKGLGRIALALFAGTLVMTVSMALWNLIFTPLFMGVPRAAVLPLILPVIVPFNLIKAGVNAALAFGVYIPLKKALGRNFGPPENP